MQIQAKNGLVCCAILAALMISTIAFYCGIDAAVQIGGEGNLKEGNENESFICDESLIHIDPYGYERDD